MYERFTDRARKVMRLANQEAHRLHHDRISPEHIMLGLIKEGRGVAANVLKMVGPDLSTLRLEIENRISRAGDSIAQRELSETSEAKKAVNDALAEARSLGHNYVGTEHILLGLLQQEEGLAAKVLESLGVKLDDVRQEVLHLVGPAREPLPSRFQFSLMAVFKATTMIAALCTVCSLCSLSVTESAVILLTGCVLFVPGCFRG